MELGGAGWGWSFGIRKILMEVPPTCHTETSQLIFDEHSQPCSA